MGSLTLGGREPHVHSSECLLLLPAWHPLHFSGTASCISPGKTHLLLWFLTNMNTPVHLSSILDLLLKQNEALEIKLQSVGVSHRTIREKCAWKQRDNEQKDRIRKLEREKEKRKLFTISLMLIPAPFVLHELTNSLYLLKPFWIGLFSFDKERVWNTTPPSPHSEHTSI